MFTIRAMLSFYSDCTDANNLYEIHFSKHNDGSIRYKNSVINIDRSINDNDNDNLSLRY